MPGPVPNRSADLARPRERKGSDQQSITNGTMRPTTWPRVDAQWHPIAKMIYKAAKESGQADFYQQSDIAILWSLCDDISEYKSPRRRWNKKTEEWEEYTYRSGQMLQTIMSSLSNLLMTEGDRRRVRVELTEPESEATPAHVHVMADYREGLGVTED